MRVVRHANNIALAPLTWNKSKGETLFDCKKCVYFSVCFWVCLELHLKAHMETTRVYGHYILVIVSIFLQKLKTKNLHKYHTCICILTNGNKKFVVRVISQGFLVNNMGVQMSQDFGNHLSHNF